MPGLLLFFFLADETAESIMARVAANQERAEAARSQIVYRQYTFVRLLRTNGKVSREEKRTYTVTPTADGTGKHLDSFWGQYEKGGKLYPYDKPGFEYKNTDIDGELIDELTDDLVNDKKSKDGLSSDLFPLTTKEQTNYTFRLAGVWFRA